MIAAWQCIEKILFKMEMSIRAQQGVRVGILPRVKVILKLFDTMFVGI